MCHPKPTVEPRIVTLSDRPNAPCYHERNFAAGSLVRATTSERKEMMKRKLTIALSLRPSHVTVHPDAHAQMQWTDQGFVNVTLGVQAPSHD